MITIKFDPCRITKVEEKRRAVRAVKVGSDIKVEYESLGWFIEMEGYSFYIGQENPGITAGLQAKVTIQVLLPHEEKPEYPPDHPVKGDLGSVPL